MTHAEIVRPSDPIFDDGRVAAAGFLARYSGATRLAYVSDLNRWFRGVASGASQSSTSSALTSSCGPATWRRTEASPAPQWDDGCARSPACTASRSSTAASSVRRPTMCADPRPRASRPRWASIAWSWVRSSLRRPPPAPSTTPWRACSGLLGLRVGEACSVDIEHLDFARGHRTVTVLGKGHKLAVIPLPPRVGRAIDQAADERTVGPAAADAVGRATGPPRRHPHRAAAGQAGRHHQAHIAAFATPQLHHRRARRRACRCVTCRSRPATPIPGRQLDTTGLGRTSTAMPATSSPPSSPEPRRGTRAPLRSTVRGWAPTNAATAADIVLSGIASGEPIDVTAGKLAALPAAALRVRGGQHRPCRQGPCLGRGDSCRASRSTAASESATSGDQVQWQHRLPEESHGAQGPLWRTAASCRSLEEDAGWWQAGDFWLFASMPVSSTCASLASGPGSGLRQSRNDSP